MLDGPHAPTVVAVRVVCRVSVRECPDPPAGPQVGLEQADGHAARPLVGDDPAGEAVAGV